MNVIASILTTLKNRSEGGRLKKIRDPPREPDHVLSFSSFVVIGGSSLSALPPTY